MFYVIVTQWHGQCAMCANASQPLKRKKGTEYHVIIVMRVVIVIQLRWTFISQSSL